LLPRGVIGCREEKQILELRICLGGFVDVVHYCIVEFEVGWKFECCQAVRERGAPLFWAAFWAAAAAEAATVGSCGVYLTSYSTTELKVCGPMQRVDLQREWST
jgi:hypothetical protein